MLPLRPLGKKTPLLPLGAAGDCPVTMERICDGVLAKPMLLLSASTIVVEAKVAELVLSATLTVLSMPWSSAPVMPPLVTCLVGAEVELASMERAAEIFCVRLVSVPVGTPDAVGLASSALMAVRT